MIHPTTEPPRPHTGSTTPYDRGPRPIFRGRLHEIAAIYFAGTCTALIATVAALHHSALLIAAIILYSACLLGMLAVSALYHRVPWRTKHAVDTWRRADHSMIAIFIAGTYAPVAVSAFTSMTDGLWILPTAWIAAIGTVVITLLWPNHPRWVDVIIYLVLGWLVILKAPALASVVPLAALILIVAGGVTYSLGAIIYGIQRPNPSERWFGFHEVFHATTIIAAAMHHIAIWILVVN
ncbi:hemolysin III family protein [Corynebacterium kroppenstedtii]|uniref:PAQR family membrane homeostasis protein TrhA n=1 Tax=Corynebacterium sp. PCR 32 TaxID=3351342 RepID=UPI003094F9C6